MSLAEVADIVAAVQGRVAVHARHLGTGEELAVGPVDDAFPTGSAAKACVLWAFTTAVADGTVDPTGRVVVDAAYRDARSGSGVLRHLGAGLAPSLLDCATLMMIVSDNVATDLLLDALGGPEVVNEVLARTGIEGAAVTSPTVWVMPPGQFGMASPRALSALWAAVDEETHRAELCRSITWRHQHREGFGRHVPFHPDLPDFGMASPLGLWSKAGSYPTVSCEAGLFRSGDTAWVLAVMADGLADWGNGSAAAGPTLRAEVARAVHEAWAPGATGP